MRGSSLFKLRASFCRKMLSNETGRANRNEQHDSAEKTSERKMNKVTTVQNVCTFFIPVSDNKNDFYVNSSANNKHSIINTSCDITVFMCFRYLISLKFQAMFPL